MCFFKFPRIAFSDKPQWNQQGVHPAWLKQKGEMLKREIPRANNELILKNALVVASEILYIEEV